MALDPRSDDLAPQLDHDTRIAAVVSGYHREITYGMLGSASATLERAGLDPGNLLVIEVPGTFELPIVAQRLASRDDLDAVLCFGLVLQGETDHHTHLATSVASALQQVALDNEVPVLFGVLTCRTLEQAQERARRADQDGLDKGREVALAAIGVLEALAEAEEDFPSDATEAEAEEDADDEEDFEPESGIDFDDEDEDQ
jgi:6,7-dimethyl-8-ribityllumazine synthase